MEYYNDILCISGTELIRSENNPTGVLSKPYYDKMVRAKQLNVVRRGCYGTPALIDFDSLPSKYRVMVEKIHLDPRKAAVCAPFASRIKHDPKVRETFVAYRYDVDKKLPAETIDKYCNDVAIFDALQPIITEMTAKRKAGSIRKGKVNNLGVEQMGVWQYALTLVDSVRKIFPCNMPKTERTLQRKYQKYIADGWFSLIHSGFGNTNRIKLDELGRTLLMALCKDGNKQHATTIADTYNKWANENRCQAITSRMVLQFMDNNAIEITMFRDGKAAWDDKFDKVIRRYRPSAPLMLVNADDNDLDLYYTRRQIIGGKTLTDKYYRPKLYVVIDTAYNYILGYAVGETVTIELIKEAFRNAQHHLKQLTGSHHLWGQLVTDRWGVGKDSELKRYFESQAKFTPPPAGKPRSKAIEQSFGSLWHNVLSAFDNYAGPGLNAKGKSNPDFISENIKHNAKPYAQIKSDVETFVNTLRLAKWKESGQSRQELWLADFASQNVSARRAINDETYLMTFGTAHSETNRATNEGIKITVNKQRYIYDIPAEIYRSVVGKQMQVYYDTADMSRVLATDGKHRFIAATDTAMAMALDDMRTGDRERLNTKLAEKQMHKIEIIDRDMYENALLARHGINARSLIKAGVLKKSVQQEAAKIAQIPVSSLEDTIINIHSLM